MMNHRRHRQAAISLSISCAAMFLLLGSPAGSVHAQTWDGGGSDDNWSTPLNWSPDSTPANDASANIIMSGSTRLAPVVDAPWQILGLNFAAGSAPFNISGQELTTHAGGIVNLDNDLQTINNAINLGAGQTWDANQGNLLFEGPVDLNGSALTVTGGFDTAINGAMTGNATLNKTGTGTLTLTHPGNDLSNGDLLLAGTVAINAGGGMSNRLGIVGSGQLDGVMVVDGPGSAWTNSNTLRVGLGQGTGTLNITNGAVVSNTDGFINTIKQMATATVVIDGPGSTWTNSGVLMIGGDSVFTFGQGSLNIQNGGAVSNVGKAYIAPGKGSTSVGKVVIDGPGSMWTNSSNLYVGGDENNIGVGAGGLTVQNGGAINAAGTLVIRGPGTVELLGGTITTGGLVYLNPPFGGVGTFTWTDGTLGITGTGGVRFGTGGGPDRPFAEDWTLISNQTLEVTNTTTIESSGTLTLNGGTLQTNVLDHTSGGTITLDGGTLRTGTLALDPGSVFNFNSGTIHVTNGFTADNTATNTIFGGSPQIVAGQTLQVTGTTTIPTNNLLVLNGGTWSTDTLVNNGTMLLNAGTFNLMNSDLTVGATGQFGTTAEFNSATTVNVTNGNLIVESGGVLNTNGALAAQGGTNDGRIRTVGGSLTFANGATNNAGAQINAINATLDFGVAGLTNDATLKLIDTTVNGDVTNNGSIAIAGTSTFTGTVSGSGSFTGSGTVIFDGTFSPGNSPGNVAVEGDTVLGTDAILVMELGGTTVGIDYDHIDVAGTLTTDGVLEVRLLDGFAPGHGDAFDLLDFGSLNGSFDAIILPTLSSGLSFDTTSLLTTGVISVVPEPATLTLLSLGCLLVLRRRLA